MRQYEKYSLCQNCLYITNCLYLYEKGESGILEWNQSLPYNNKIVTGLSNSLDQ